LPGRIAKLALAGLSLLILVESRLAGLSDCVA
jgi:hypothetical protein